MGVLNLTIDNAPIMPNDRAIFDEIIVVIKYATTGRKIAISNWV